MATLTQPTLTRPEIKPRLGAWLATAGVLMALLALLTTALTYVQLPSADQTISQWVVSQDVPALGALFDGVNPMMGKKIVILGVGIVAFLWMVGLRREAVAFGIVGVIIGIVAVAADASLGEILARERPAGEGSGSYPSGHVFGSTVFFGSLGFAAIHYKLRKRLLVPLLLFLTTLILAVGYARILDQAHWPTDVAAGYVLGALLLLLLLLLIPFFFWVQKLPWLPPSRRALD